MSFEKLVLQADLRSLECVSDCVSHCVRLSASGCALSATNRSLADLRSNAQQCVQQYARCLYAEVLRDSHSSGYLHCRCPRQRLVRRRENGAGYAARHQTRAHWNISAPCQTRGEPPRMAFPGPRSSPPPQWAARLFKGFARGCTTSLLPGRSQMTLSTSEQATRSEHGGVGRTD